MVIGSQTLSISLLPLHTIDSIFWRRRQQRILTFVLCLFWREREICLTKNQIGWLEMDCVVVGCVFQNLIYTLFFSQPFYVCDRITKELFPQRERERERGRRVGTSLTFLYLTCTLSISCSRPFFCLTPSSLSLLSLTLAHTRTNTRTLLSLSNPFAYYSSGLWLRPRCDVNILINLNGKNDGHRKINSCLYNNNNKNNNRSNNFDIFNQKSVNTSLSFKSFIRNVQWPEQWNIQHFCKLFVSELFCKNGRVEKMQILALLFNANL